MGFKLLSDNEHIDFQKKCQKLHRAGENQGDQLVRSCASITGTGGKPSTWFPPGILVELPPVIISRSRFSSKINKNIFMENKRWAPVA